MTTVMVSVQAVDHELYGKCLSVENETYTLMVPLDYGIRIIHFSLREGCNVFFYDANEAITQSGDAFAKMGSDGWKLRGGHRLWTSPEAFPRTYAPDDQPITWSKTEAGVLLTSAPEPWTHLQKQIEIRFVGEEVELIHRVTNVGAWTIETAPWSLNVMAPGGTAVIPQVSRDTGLLPNRNLILWPYTRMNDERVEWGNDAIVIKQSQDADQAFKIGINHEPGFAACVYPDVTFELRYEHKPEAVYPDGGCSFECYTNEHMMELETLAPLEKLEPGQTVEHKETWKLVTGQTVSHYRQL